MKYEQTLDQALDLFKENEFQARQQIFGLLQDAANDRERMECTFWLGKLDLLGDREETIRAAIQKFCKVLTSDVLTQEFHAGALLSLGACYFRLSQFEEAKSYFMEVLRAEWASKDLRNDSVYEANYWLAETYYHSGYYSKSLKQVRMIQKLDGTRAVADYSLAGLRALNLYGKGKLQAAIKEFELAFTLMTDEDEGQYNADYHLYLGFSYFAKNRYAEAAEQLKRHLEMAPNNLQAYEYLVWAYLYNDAAPRALFTLYELDRTQMAREHVELFKYLEAVAYGRMNDPQNMYRAMQELAEINPNSKLLQKLSQALHRQMR